LVNDREHAEDRRVAIIGIAVAYGLIAVIAMAKLFGIIGPGGSM
jgi:hypothetical protein